MRGGMCMSLVTTIEIIKKELYQESVVLLKVGTFYNAYFNDAILISYLFGYKVKKLDNNVSNCGFPTSALNNVKYMLEQKKINYIIIDRAHNYEENEKEDFKNENTYLECYQKANKCVTLKNRIENLSKYLLDNIDKEDIIQKIERMECVMNEER